MTTGYINGVLGNHRYVRWNREDSGEDYTKSEVYAEDEQGRQHRLTPFEKFTLDMTQDEKVVKELTLGKRIGFYRIRGEIGSGNFSQVKLGIHSLTKEKVAIKILDKTKLDQKTQRLLSREVSSMEKLHHPNVIRLYEVMETLSKLHLVMEYANGGELFAKITTEGKLSEVESKYIFSQIVSAVQHMHACNIIHRDLKAENVFYTSNTCVKVGDFGFSTVSKKEEMLNTFCGSPPYAAPELFRDESYVGIYVDIWALGILLYFMTTGMMPFRADTVAKLKKCILEGTYLLPPFLSEACQKLIQGVLQPVPTERSSIEHIMNNEWMKGVQHPKPLEPFKLNPKYLTESGVLKEEEAEVKKILYSLGITEDHIQNNHSNNSRSSITGIYRIILHRVQKKRAMESVPIISQPGEQESKKEPSTYRGLKHSSKLCLIL
ncbi:serine/threonine-protein kinase NIM1 [Tiliqua scincoides]|uniref:serine/threonine-protein kinase NIM1 n=1 Tax=Tiliqua scincoides TaxID=71010 RepID=UPI00346188DE